MPIYEFKCLKCNEEFEELVFSDEDEVKCEACGDTKVEKLMSCCRHKTAGGGGAVPSSGASSGGGCGGCTGGNCATCH